MTHLAQIKAASKVKGLTFEKQNSRINGAQAYKFVDEMGQTVKSNYTVASAFEELQNGDLF